MVASVSEHFDKLGCVPRSVILAARRKGVALDPDEVYRAFAGDIDDWSKVQPVAPVSLAFEIARHFQLCRHWDVSHEVDTAGKALATANVLGVLITWERVRLAGGTGTFEPHCHMAVVTQILRDQFGRQHVEIDSPRAGDRSERVVLAAADLSAMGAVFHILFGGPPGTGLNRVKQEEGPEPAPATKS